MVWTSEPFMEQACPQQVVARLNAIAGKTVCQMDVGSMGWRAKHYRDMDLRSGEVLKRANCALRGGGVR